MAPTDDDSVPLDGGHRGGYGRGEPLIRGPVQNPGYWAGREAARTPVRFRDRVIAQFLSHQNLDYLRGLFARRAPAGRLRKFLLDTLHDSAVEFTSGEGRAFDVLLSDPIAQRGAGRASASLWSEIKRLNGVFFEDRMALIREQAAIIDPVAPRDGVSEDTEDYAMRMFTSDSLRPPGLEHMNTPGPNYALREDQSTWERPRAGREGPPREGFAAARSENRAASGDHGGSLPSQDDDSVVFFQDTDDSPWDSGRPNRTPEQAMAEYWGDGWTTSDTTVGQAEQMRQTYGDASAWGSKWQENGGTRFMRYEHIPRWQHLKREGVDYDIDEDLGTQMKETGNPVRRVDMSRLRDPRGQEYKRYGPRTGHIV